MKAIILAGGKGTRLAPYTTVFPKPMLPIGDMPILEIVIRQLAYHGFKDIVLSVGYLAELIQAYFQNGGKIPTGVTLTYVKEERPLGTTGSILLVPNLTETFLVMNGDVLTTLDYSNLIDFHKKNGGVVTIAMHKRQVKIDFGVLYTDKANKVVNYDEKPSLDYSVSMGIYVFEPEAMKYIPAQERFDFPELIQTLIKRGKGVIGYSTDEYWLDIGRHDDYADAVENFEKNKRLFLK